MNYKLKSSRPKCHFIFELAEGVVIKNSDGRIVLTKDCVNSVWESNLGKNTRNYIYDGESFIIFFQQGESKFINVKNGNIDHTERRFYYLKRKEVSAYLPLDNQEKVIIEKDKKVSFEYVQSEKWFYGDFFIQKPYNTETLLCASMDSGDSLWRIDASQIFPESEKMRIHRDLTFHNDSIYFYAIGNSEDMICCLDIHTGKVKHEYKKLRGHLKAEGDYLYNLLFDHLNILNGPGNTINTYDLKPAFGSLIYRADYSQWTVNNGLLYLSQTSGADKYSGTQGSTVAVMDIGTRQILWYYTFPVENGLVSGIYAGNERIFVSMQDSTLHIFEKTEWK